MDAWTAEILERVRMLEKRQHMILGFISLLMAYVYTTLLSKVALLLFGLYEMWQSAKDDYAQLYRMLKVRA